MFSAFLFSISFIADARNVPQSAWISPCMCSVVFDVLVDACRSKKQHSKSLKKRGRRKESAMPKGVYVCPSSELSPPPFLPPTPHPFSHGLQMTSTKKRKINVPHVAN